jgi:ABC-type glycerol-3-phosphate transport system substrate-binding protein
MRRLWWRGVVIALCLVVVGFTPAWTAQQEVTLRVMIPEHHRLIKPLEENDRSSVVPRRLWFYDMVQSFKKKYPHIKLRFESAVYDHVTSIFINKSMAGDPPDITFLPNGPQFKLARAGYLYPLDRFPFDWKDYNENMLRENMTVDGKIYLVPTYTVPHVLYYNKEIYEKAGIKEPPKTWDELIAVAKKLTKDTKGEGKIDVWGLGMPASPSHPPFVYQSLEPIIWLLGGKLEEKGRALIDTPEMRKAVQLYVDLVHVHKVMPEAVTTWDKEYMANFRNEKLAMTLRGAEEYVPSVAKLGDKVGLARVPVFKPGDRPYTWMEVWGYGMSKRAGETKPEAAWAFLNQFASEETFVLAAEFQKGLPTRKSVANHPIYKSSPEFEFQAKYVVEAGRADPFIEEWEAWGDIISRTAQAAVLRLGKVEDLLKNAQREYDARLKR